ncbi:MAG: 23S rRNA (pseudouridine(1915)-N(3))-methyltransferase RlmH [Eubacteriales bacterium]|nr:23S rRNA (pseudouridine(1915)-N(3))-methyltransferase RlmH [Eubacteriales bacterium]
MRVRILAVGKVKEAFFREAAAEYQKRLGRYCRLEIVEVADERTDENASPAQVEAVLEREGSRLLSQIRDGEYVVALAIGGKRLDSPGLAEKIRLLGLSGRSSVSFVIGGSWGLSKSVLSRADFSLSFSDMTFPHQLMRVILLEQVYRSFRIICGEPYHK